MARGNFFKRLWNKVKRLFKKPSRPRPEPASPTQVEPSSTTSVHSTGEAEVVPLTSNYHDASTGDESSPNVHHAGMPTSTQIAQMAQMDRQRDLRQRSFRHELARDYHEGVTPEGGAESANASEVVEGGAVDV